MEEMLTMELQLERKFLKKMNNLELMFLLVEVHLNLIINIIIKMNKEYLQLLTTKENLIKVVKNYLTEED